MSHFILEGAKITKNFNFPGGEAHISLEPVSNFDEPVFINAQLTDSDGIMKLLLITDGLKRLGYKRIWLNMPYVPYARQDRVCNPGEAHSLKVFASIINSQNYEYVKIFDPHSDVTEALLNNVVVFNNHNFVKDALQSIQETNNIENGFHLVSPDAGAYKKIFYLGKFLAENNFDFNIVNCNKERDTKTGAITNFTVGATDLGGKPCVIVDDICDGGGTFLGLADALKAVNAGDLYLVVSHGIFSQGLDKLLTKFQKIVTTSSFTMRDTLPEYAERYIVR